MGGVDLIIIKINNNDKIALKFVVLIFLFIKSKYLIPLFSILIKNKPKLSNFMIYLI